MENGIIRQGDVWLVPLSKSSSRLLDGLRKHLRASVDPKEGIIVAAGEATGHHHRIRTKGAVLYKMDAPRRNRIRDFATRLKAAEAVQKIGSEVIVRSPRGGATITHEEHAALAIPEGDYKVVIAREYVPQAAPRRVYD